LKFHSNQIYYTNKKSDDEDGIKKKPQRAGGCCEPVQFLKEKILISNCPALLNWQLNHLVGMPGENR